MNKTSAAQTIMDEHGGKFPQDFEQIQTLSGIGRSTAAAIASFAFNQNQTILDGNVKRVLARHYLIEGWTGTPKTEKQLWTLAESLVPEQELEMMREEKAWAMARLVIDKIMRLPAIEFKNFGK
ncbi:MAG: hypothetical protein EBV25_05980 [Methylophilaceae bacterium]|nr:hypothetical protein [Methylophilaceae bacterium]